MSVLLAFLTILALFALQRLFVLWFINRDLIAWWQKGAALKKYNRYMSIWLVLSQVQGTDVLSFILKIFYSPSANLTVGSQVVVRRLQGRPRVTLSLIGPAMAVVSGVHAGGSALKFWSEGVTLKICASLLLIASCFALERFCEEDARCTSVPQDP